MFNFENLSVYQKSIQLSEELIIIAVKFPPSYRRISDQLVGAVISIALNIAEGNGRLTQKDKNQFYRISRASAFELVAILDICDRLSLLEKKIWIIRVEEICKMLSGLTKKVNTFKS